MLHVLGALVALPFVLVALLSLALHIAPGAMDRALRRWLPKQVIKPAEYVGEGEWRILVPAVVNNYFDIKDDNGRLGIAGKEVYLRRYYLSPLRWGRRLFLHNIRLSDRDRAPHSHQWRFVSLILVGKYIEHIFFPNACACGDLRCSRRYRKKHAPAGTLLINKPEHTHLVEIVRPVWSLVFIGKKTQSWGFWHMVEMPGRTHGQRSDAPPDRFVPWDEYLNLKKTPAGEDVRKV